MSGPASPVLYHIDLLTVFLDTVNVAGWIVHPDAALSRLEVLVDETVLFEVADRRLASPDVAAQHGGPAANCRFWGRWTGRLAPGAVAAMRLRARFETGEALLIEAPSAGALRVDPVHRLGARLAAMLADAAPGLLLEVGSRARSGVTRRHMTPDGWRYLGIDILDGPNVDLVCDAHALSRSMAAESVDAVMSFSVFEHLLMPWKVALELNAVLRPGAPGLIVTHQAWPMHEQPWDFWRYSADAWQALFNEATGFEIIETAMGEPAYLVAQHCHAVTDFPPQAASFLSSGVLVRRTGRTRLAWDVESGAVTSTMYPRKEEVLF